MESPVALDVEKARNQFPALKQDQVFFDNAGGSQVLGSVADSIAKYLTTTNVQLGASYKIGNTCTKAYEQGYAAAAKYISASPEEIVLNASTTQLFRNLSYALSFPAGSELVISALDHEANIAPWISLAHRQQLTIKWWLPSSPSSSAAAAASPIAPDDDGDETAALEDPQLRAADLRHLLTEKTVLVTCTHVSNVLGTIHDIRAIADAVHTVKGAMLVVDAVAYAPHRSVDVKELGVDFYCFSWYKLYGPHIAMLYGRAEAQDRVNSLGHYFNPSSSLRNKLDLASSNYECTQSIPTVVSYFGPDVKATWKTFVQQEHALQKILLDYLNKRDDVVIYGERDSDPAKRVPTISFTVRGWRSSELVQAVEAETPFAFRWGAFYSNRLVEEILGLGSEGVVRVSMVHYNTDTLLTRNIVDEITKFVEKLDEVLSRKKETRTQE